MLNDTTTPTLTTTSTTTVAKVENIVVTTYEKTVEKGEEAGIPKWGTISILIGERKNKLKIYFN